ncbi:hypothetical protein C2G38_2097614 [Gigaspora rosea]|uniref:Uncharacterized protein n=1 Tax=Gigaspora rosea TaxID=44941 RepID=A0A397UYB7_9GLOM|nr:hypothetical protein C2G38_2097614 [Gigaspora rosea]
MCMSKFCSIFIYQIALSRSLSTPSPHYSILPYLIFLSKSREAWEKYSANGTNSSRVNTISFLKHFIHHLNASFISLSMPFPLRRQMATFFMASESPSIALL